MAKNGPQVMMIDASTGEVMFKPVMNSPWLKITPQNDPTSKKPWSLKGTFSFDTKSDAIQNAAAPNRILDRVSPSGEIQVGKSDFESGMLIPKINVTANIIRCPVFLFFGMWLLSVQL